MMNDAQKIVLLINQKTDEYTRACRTENFLKNKKIKIEEEIININNEINRPYNRLSRYRFEDKLLYLEREKFDIDKQINNAKAKKDTLKIEIDNYHKYLEGYTNMKKEQNINFSPNNTINFSPIINNTNSTINNNIIIISNLDELKKYIEDNSIESKKDILDVIEQIKNSEQNNNYKDYIDNTLKLLQILQIAITTSPIVINAIPFITNILNNLKNLIS